MSEIDPTTEEARQAERVMCGRENHAPYEKNPRRMCDKTMDATWRCECGLVTWRPTRGDL